MTSISLFKQMALACKQAEEEWRHNEKVLQMQLDCATEERKRIINLLEREDVSDSDKIQSLKSYYGIR